ncbi:hypothetical protein V7U47_09080 [Segatella copri]
MAVKSGRKPNNRSRNFSGIPQSLIAEGCRKSFFTDNNVVFGI